MSTEIAHLGTDVWFDVTVNDAAQQPIDLNTVVGWEIDFAFKPTALAKSLSSSPDLTINTDGTMRVKLTDAETATLTEQTYKPYVKVTDANGNKWMSVAGTPIFDFQDNPLKLV